MPVDEHALFQLALSWDEYRLIVERLDREPTDVELGMIGALWSEHCGYKHSKPLLRLFPTEGPRILTRIGEENAGVVDIGDGFCVAMKIESHNHPSAIEPYEGAATGIGGIVRDIIALGARPVALVDPLRFGLLSEPRNRYLFTGVVSGIGGYGNCLGIPTVAGEVSFADSYSGNPLINVMCVGLARIDRLVRGRAEGPGNLLMLVGADTGRDGLHGATFASVELDERSEERRPAVQVGNPFMEKLLMEACVELAEQHRDWITGIEDLGAAGITSAVVESAARGGSGVDVDVSRVPRREQGMTPYEVMISESQERMLVIVKREHEEEVRRHFERWELQPVVIGVVTDDGYARICDGEQEVARLPVALLTNPPQYVREKVKPAILDQLQNYDLASLPDLTDPALARLLGVQERGSPGTAALLRLLATPEIASKRWVWRQYDHQVITNTVVAPGADAAVLRVKGTRKGIALASDGNGLYCYLDPYQGGAIAVAEAARNVVCAGAEPIALTDCLNLGNPEKPEVYYQLDGVIRGMAAACEKLGTPVISGNVSLYNETTLAGETEAIYPTPVVGMLGLLEDIDQRCGTAFQNQGDLVFLLGASLEGDPAALGGSEYLREVHDLLVGRPSIDLEREARVQRACLEAIRRGLLRSAHDCSHGGLAVTLAESCIEGGIGLDASGAPVQGRLDAALFGEAQSRIVLSCPPEARPDLEALARQHDVPLTYLGTVGGDRLRLASLLDAPIADLSRAYEEGLPRALAG